MTETQEISFTSDIRVEMIKTDFSDEWPCFAAWTSTKGADATPERKAGLINRLMADRHGTPFEMMDMTFRVTAPLFVWREHHRHRIGFCVAKDTEIILCDPNGKNLRRNTIEEIYNKWHIGVTDSIGRTRLLPSSQNIHARTYDEETLLPQPGRVLDVVKAGVKPSLIVNTLGGRIIRCSPEHRILTIDGWKRAYALTDNDFALRAGKRAIRDLPPIPPELRRGIGIWTERMRPHLIKPIDTCYICDEKFDFDQLQLDHVVTVSADLSRALDVNNLKPACITCHRVKTNSEQMYAERLGSQSAAVPDRIVSITRGEPIMMYDLVIDKPWHNYMANGLVVHNSYNEESGRYRQLDPVFYVPDRSRPLVPAEGTKQMDYQVISGSDRQYNVLSQAIKEVDTIAYTEYCDLLDMGILKEVARLVLPVNIMSTCIVKCNARSLMNFLALRTQGSGSKPMYEIETVAVQYEACFAVRAPMTHKAFCFNGRVAP